MLSTKKTLSIFALGLFIFGGSVLGMLPSSDYSKAQVVYMEQTARKVFEQCGENVTMPQFQKKCMEYFKADGKVVFQEKYRKLLDENDWVYEVEYQLTRLAEKNVPIPSDEELNKTAEKMYPIYQKGQRVTIVYKKNPLVITSLEGIFQRCESGFIHIAGRQIRLQDMEGIVDNEKEILKFLPAESNRRRQEYIDGVKKDVKVKRKAWREENQERLSAELLKSMGRVNEKNGYVFYRGDWHNMKETCALVSEDVWRNCIRQIQKQEARKQKNIVRNMKVKVQVLAYMGEISPLGTRLSPEAELERRAILRQKELKLQEEQRKKAEEIRKARIREEQEKLKAIELEKKRKRQRQLEQIRNQVVENPDDFETGFFTTNVLFGGMVIVLVLGIGLLFTIRKKERGNDLSKFFKGKGKIQEDFWKAAAADPDHFRYVSYLFPGIAEANNALSQMSYIGMDSSGQLHCNKNIKFGVYPHQKGAVAFVGGVKLNYALWKEASAVWPELEGAQYFKVSPEPVVLVEIPDMVALNGENSFNVKDLGIEDITGENGEIIRCYNFACDTKEHAVGFLEKFNINEEGVVVHIVFNEGKEKMGKDINGAFDM